MAPTASSSPATNPLENALSRHLEARAKKSTYRTLPLPLAHSADFSSNDFLSLSTNKEFHKAWLAELTSDMANFRAGYNSSRLMDGNSTYVEELERSIARFHGAEAGLIFNSGYDANVGLFGCLPQEGDVVVYDEWVHASVFDGLEASKAGGNGKGKARMVRFRHNDVGDLERVVGECVRGEAGVKEGRRSVVVVVESVYSMDGDVCPLLDVVIAVEKLLPKGNGYVFVDEAHSTGVLGPQGRGLVCELGLEKRVWARMHTFGKAMASMGAIVLGPAVLRSYLINYARPLIYTTALPFPVLASIRTAYSFLEQGKTEQMQSTIHTRVSELHQGLSDLFVKYSHIPDIDKIFHAPAIRPVSAVYPIFTQRPWELAGYLKQNGILAHVIHYPAVPLGTERIRVVMHGANTAEDVQRFVGVLEKWVVEMVEGKSEMVEKARL